MALIPRQVFPWERITAPKQQRPAQDDEEVEEIHVWPNYSQALVPRAGEGLGLLTKPSWEAELVRLRIPAVTSST